MKARIESFNQYDLMSQKKITKRNEGLKEVRIEEKSVFKKKCGVK